MIIHRAMHAPFIRVLLALVLIASVAMPVAAITHEDRGKPGKSGHPQPPKPPVPPDPPSGPAHVVLKGQIRDLPDAPSLMDVWTILDRVGKMWEVEVTAETKITPRSAEPVEGDWVHVTGRGEKAQRTLVADHINVEQGGEGRARPAEIKGQIEVLPETLDFTGDWVVDGITFTVDSHTMIHPDRLKPEVGMLANVSAFQQLEGTLWAKNIALHPAAEPPSEIKFEGTIESLPEDGLLGTWMVHGISVTVAADTELRGAPPAVGLWAEVEGSLQEDSSVLAKKIDVEEPEMEKVELEGIIESLPEDGLLGIWVVRSISVAVTADTELKGAVISVGLWAEVEGVLQADGSVLASEIKVQGPDIDDSSALNLRRAIWRAKARRMSEAM